MKDIIDLFKETNKKVYVIIILIFAVVNVEFLRNIKENKKAIFESLQIIMQNLINILPVFILVFSWLFLLRVSNKKSNEIIAERFNQAEEYQIRNKRLLVEIKDNIVPNLNSPLNIMEIIVKNNQNENINSIKGIISFYYQQVRIKKIEINIHNLKSGYGERVYFDKFESRWNQCDLYIDEIVCNETIDKHVLLSGEYRIYTNYVILNLEKFYDYTLMGFKFKSNLVWLKEKINLVFESVSYIYRKRYFDIKHSITRSILSLLIRSVLFVLIYVLLLAFIILIVAAVANSIYCFMDLLKIWGNVLINNLNQKP
ncbi:hypothetical protein [Paenibacillus tundrae]|uniref:Uncharacterized protein n=1 Tax=Paenibacillus tundrae TaxID=528187 RepID=A0ABT9WBS9_9BACL|nr:hypothetical protein [Paenibacillus tundrae]MDQ0170585.1 hypothetical protein [Paenibacillus tundrae]